MKISFIHVCVISIFVFFGLITINFNPVFAESSIIFQNGNVAPGDSSYTIDESAGQRSGNNLFHSFQQFNLLKDETANFTGSESIQNVINRVTGGASSINGTIRSYMPDANFYFINPAGIVFGPEASLDIGGSFFVSTADYIRGSDSDKKFHMTEGEPMIFADNPAAFGFLDHGTDYGSIEFQGLGEFDIKTYTPKDTLGIKVEPGKSISIIGGDISFQGSSYYGKVDPNDENSETILFSYDNLYSNGGRINIASIKSEQEVSLQHIFEVDSIEEMNDLSELAHENDIAILSNGDAQKETYQYSVSENTWIQTDDLTTIAGTRIGEISSETIMGNIQLSDNAVLSVSGVPPNQISNDSNYLDESGEIIIKGGRILLEHSKISSTNYGSDPAGNIYIQGNTITVKDESIIDTDNLGLGKGGNITISGHQSTHVDTISLIRSTLSAASKPLGEDGKVGDAGDITIYGKKINLSSSYRLSDDVFTSDDIPDEIKQILRDIDFSYSTKENLDQTLLNNLKSDYYLYKNYISTTFKGSEINSGAIGTGAGGNITIDAQNYEYISINGKTTIKSNAESSGSAGDITIKAPIVTISGSSADPTEGGISSDSSGTGAGGNIFIEGDLISIAEFAFIKTDTINTGAGGNILLQAKNNISLSTGGLIVASTQKSGKAGKIQLIVHEGIVQISGEDTAGDSSSIRSRCHGEGNAQEISIQADNINLIYGGFIGSETFNKGNGGKVTLWADESINFWGTDNSGYASKVYTTSDYVLGTPGKSGDIELFAKDINFKDGAGITASTLGAGNGGTVLVKADTIRLSGSNPHGENADGVATGFFAQSEFKGPFDSDDKGNADTLSVYANELYLEDGAVISTSTIGGGDAGNIDLYITDKLIISGKRTESDDPKTSQTNYQAMNDLNKNYESGIFSRSQCSEPYAGDAGTITIKNLAYKDRNNPPVIPDSTPYIELDDFASISTATYGKGNAGNIDIYAKKINVKNGASISSESLNIYFEPDAYDDSNDAEMRQINFRIFSIEMTSQQSQLVPSIDYIDIIAEEGDIGKVTVDHGSYKETKYYIFNDGWFEDESGLSNYQLLTPELIKTSFDKFSTLKQIPLTDQKTLSQCQYIDIDISIDSSSGSSKVNFTMEKGKADNFVYDGSTWHQLENDLNELNTETVSEIMTTLNINNECLQISDYVIQRYLDVTVQKFYKSNNQWLPYQSGGNAGTINIKNSDPAVQGELFITGIDSQELIDLDVIDNTRISTTTKGAGNAGEISILMQNIYLTQNGEISSASDSEGNGGTAGTISLGNTDNFMELLNIESAAQVSTSTKGLGNAGNINIVSKEISLSSQGSIASSSNAVGNSGDAGTIIIQTDSLSLIDLGTTINTSTNGQGVAGSIFVSTQKLNLDQESNISSASNSIGKGGDAGKITIGKTIEISDQNEFTMAEASDTIILKNKSTISTSSAGAGNAGNVTLKANTIDIHQSSSVSSANSSVAEIIYVVDNLSERDTLTPKVGMVVEVSDAGNGNAQTYIYTGEAWEARNQLRLNRVDTMNNLNTIDAVSGDIAKVADAGDGYSKNFIYTGQNWVEIVSDKTVQVYVAKNMTERDQIDPEKGDIVEIVDDQGDLLETYIFDSEKWVAIQWADILDDNTAKAFQVNSLNDISLQRISDGDRADVAANDVSNQRKAVIRSDETDSEQIEHYIYTNNSWKQISKAGDAGKVDIYAKDQVTLSSGGSLNTEAISSGGGQISIQGDRSLYLFTGLITASVQKGFGKGGDITTKSKSVLMNHSGIEANAVEGDGGAIFITTEQYIKSDESTVTATSERGNDGTVKIDAPKVDISKGLVILPTNFLDATRWVKTPCALRSGESVSRLVVEGRDAVPTSLVDWQPSPPTDITAPNKPSKKKKTSQLNHPTLLTPPNNKMAMNTENEISLFE